MKNVIYLFIFHYKNTYYGIDSLLVCSKSFLTRFSLWFSEQKENSNFSGLSSRYAAPPLTRETFRFICNFYFFFSFETLFFEPKPKLKLRWFSVWILRNVYCVSDLIPGVISAWARLSKHTLVILDFSLTYRNEAHHSIVEIQFASKYFNFELEIILFYHLTRRCLTNTFTYVW